MNRPFQVCFPFGKRWPDEYFVLIMWVEQGQKENIRAKSQGNKSIQNFPKIFLENF